MYHILVFGHAAHLGDRYGRLCGYCDPSLGLWCGDVKVKAHAIQKFEVWQLLHRRVIVGELQPTLLLMALTAFTCQLTE